MALAQISPNSVTTNPAHINPQVKTDQSATTANASQTADHAIKKARTDTVTISRRAAQMAAQTRESAQRTREQQTEVARKKLTVTA